jgi:hypothetical protein
MGEYGMPVDTIDQLDEIGDFILRIGSRRVHSFGRDRFVLYLYRLHNYCNTEYEKIKGSKMSKSEKMEKQRWRTIGSYAAMVSMARVEFPGEDWYEMKIKREFDRIAEMFPDALELDELPTDVDDFPLDATGASMEI